MPFFILALLAFPISYLFLVFILSQGAIKKMKFSGMFAIYCGVFSILILPIVWRN